MRRLVAALLMGVAMQGVALANDDEAKAFAQAFCSLGDLEQGMGRMYLLSASLTEAVKSALAENAKLQAATPDEKPPLGDGVPWQSVPDRAPVCEAGAVLAEGESTLVEVRYSFPDAPDANWTDRLVLIPGGGALVIDDIRYGAEGDDDTLRKALTEAFRS